MNNVQEFYDNWAEDYHLIFEDWRQSMQRQSHVLDGMIKRVSGDKPTTLLDCTCGIGTQALGLASLGYKVTASDLSSKAVARAIREAKNLGVQIKGVVADVRRLDDIFSEAFDVVISFDNSLCHLVEPNDLDIAARQIKARVRPDGLFMASIRDYDAILSSDPNNRIVDQKLPGDFSKSSDHLPTATLPKLFDKVSPRRLAFQLWDWTQDQSGYTVNQFTLQEIEGQWQTSVRTSYFRALKRAQLTQALANANFRNIEWHMPEQTGFYQPIVTARA